MSQPYDPSSPRDPRLQQVLERAGADAAFRARLLAEPHAAIRDAFGINVPESFRLQFVERGPETDALIVLPNLDSRATAAPSADGALDDAELEAVAGGWDAGSGTEWNGAEWNGGAWEGGSGGSSAAGDPPGTWGTWGG